MANTLDPDSGVSIQTKFTGLDELFRMSGTITESKTDKIGDKTLLQIMAEIKPKWINGLKTNTIAHLREGLIDHITGLKDTVINMFNGKQLKPGQMLLFDTAYRKVVFNPKISDKYKALDTETVKSESVEYLLINPRLVPVNSTYDNKDISEDKSKKKSKEKSKKKSKEKSKKKSKEKSKDNPNQELNVMEIIKHHISGEKKQTNTNTSNPQSEPNPQSELEKIKSIGITSTNLYIVNPIPKTKIPAFDEDITIFMFTRDKDIDIEDTVSIGVSREPFHTDFQIDNISSHRNIIDERISKNQDITYQIKQTLQQRLADHIPQIVKKYQTMDSLFHNKLTDDIRSHLPIYQVLLPDTSFPLNHDSETQSEDATIPTLRTIRFYLLFKWMELYYDFYEFCSIAIPIKRSSNLPELTKDPLNRCNQTLEYLMYKHQTELIKKSLLYVLYQLYDFTVNTEEKQIYTPEMLVYDLGKIIETHKETIIHSVAFGTSVHNTLH